MEANVTQQKTYTSVQELLDDSGNQEIAELFRQQQPYRDLVSSLRKRWNFEPWCFGTVDSLLRHSWRTREDFIEKELPGLIEAIEKQAKRA